MVEESLLTQTGHHQRRHSAEEQDVVQSLSDAFELSPLHVAQKLQNFPRHVRRQNIARFLAKYEIFKLALPVHGSIVEGGVFAGGGLFTWLHFSSILEPYNHSRHVIGFDTFSGFPSVDEVDIARGTSEHLRVGAFDTHDAMVDELQTLASLHDRNRPLGHIPKISLVVGDAKETIPRYLIEQPHLIVSLLYLDFDLYEPTRIALQLLYTRIPKGGIVAFDELNCPEFPGETMALLETIGCDRIALQRFPFDPYISYFIKGSE